MLLQKTVRSPAFLPQVIQSDGLYLESLTYLCLAKFEQVVQSQEGSDDDHGFRSIHHLVTRLGIGCSRREGRAPEQCGFRRAEGEGVLHRRLGVCLSGMGRDLCREQGRKHVNSAEANREQIVVSFY